MGLEPRVQLDVASRYEDFLVDTGATYSVLTSYFGAFSSQTCTILGATGKQLQKYSPKHFFVTGMDKYFPTSFWSLSIEGVMGSSVVSRSCRALGAEQLPITRMVPS